MFQYSSYHNLLVHFFLNFQFIDNKKTASQSTGYFFNLTTNQSHQRPYTDVTLQAP